MNLRRGINELFNPHLKKRRIIDEQHEKYLNNLEQRILNEKFPLKEMYEAYFEANQKQRELPENHKGIQELEDIKENIKAAASLKMLFILIKYLKKISKKDKRAHTYIHVARKVFKKYHILMDRSLETIIKELKEIEDFVHPDHLKEESEFLKIFRKEILYYNSIEWFTNYFKYKHFEEIKTIIEKPLQYFLQEKEQLRRINFFILKIDEQIEILKTKQHKWALNKETSQFKDLLREIRFLIQKEESQYNKLITMKRDVDEHVALLEHGYTSLMKFMGSDFAAHGTSLDSAEKNLLGFPTGGQGGANFIINDVEEMFGDKGSYMVTECHHLIKEAFRHGASIRIAFRDGDEILFEGKKLLVKEKTVMKTTIHDLSIFKNKKRRATLQIEKDSNTHIKAPWVVVTSENQFKYLKNQNLKNDNRIIDIHNNTFEITNNLHQFTRNLMLTGRGRAYLMSHLR